MDALVIWNAILAIVTVIVLAVAIILAYRYVAFRKIHTKKNNHSGEYYVLHRREQEVFGAGIH